jgi:geranylgeranyl diphosphate synthase, type I
MTVAASTSLLEAATRVRPAILAMLDRLDARNRLIGGYQLGFWDADGTPTASHGKSLRPALALLSGRAAGFPAERSVPAAAAVELVHNFSLLHDDVMDGDLQRRHRATAWAVFGTGPAILAGDALLSLAVDAVAGTPGAVRAGRRLGEDVRRLIAGQAADIEFERRDDVGLDECLAMAADKTGALISCSCALGALMCDAPEPLVAALSRVGDHLGLAFQLVDDLLGVWGDPRRTGKPVGADLRTRKRSVPVVRAMTSPGGAADELARLYRACRQLTDEDVARMTELIEATGARDWTRQRADEEVAAAVAELRMLRLPAEVQPELIDLAEFVAGRDR